MSKVLALIARCNQCSTQLHKTFSRQAYERGVVLLKCDGCGVRHLVADHIGWFSHVQGKNLEDYYPGQVKRGTLAVGGLTEEGKISAELIDVGEDLGLQQVSKADLDALLLKATEKATRQHD